VKPEPPHATGYRAGQLAKLAGVSTDTLRHYERSGVLPLPARAANDYRIYPPEALERVRLIRRALAIGFTLEELRPILEVRDQGGAPCRKVRALAAAKLEALEAHIRELAGLRDELRSALSEWDARLAVTPTGQPAGLLDGLGTQPPGSGSTSRLPLRSRRSPLGGLGKELE
jgi:DNA-binding transcriptional MerR regulator